MRITKSLVALILKENQLIKILKIGHETSIRGKGISLGEALHRTNYKELRNSFGPKDLLPLLKKYPNLCKEWILYSDDKRTSGGWYLKENGEIGQVTNPGSQVNFDLLSEAVAEYIVRELDFWINV